MSNTLEMVFLHADACSFAAAMASSDLDSIARLSLGKNLFEQTCNKFGGRVVDKIGDSMLLAFDTAEAAFQAAIQTMVKIKQAHDNPEAQKPFEYRIGISSGQVRLSDGALYGHCINTAARICSLVAKGHIGVEIGIWPKIRKLTEGLDSTHRRLFAKPGEPLVDFYELSTWKQGARGRLKPTHDRNVPLIAILPNMAMGLDNQNSLKSNMLEALFWEFESYFFNQGWHTVTLRETTFDTTSVTSTADYVVSLGALSLPTGMRVFATFASRHMRSGAQTFSREHEHLDQGITHVLTLASLVGSAISHSERERAEQTSAVGAHQLVAAGRAVISTFSFDKFMRGMTFLQDAAKLDPEYPLLVSSLARAHSIAWRFGWLNEGGDNLAVAQELAAQATKMAPDDARCEADLAFVKFWSNEPSDAVWHYNRSLDALPYHPELAADAGMVLGYVGQNERATQILERSVANLPSDVDYRLWSLGDVHHSLRDYRSSIKWLSRMRDQSQGQRLMAANKARLGLDPSVHVANVLMMQPDFSVGHWVGIQPFTNERDRVDFEEALLLAGLPR